MKNNNNMLKTFVYLGSSAFILLSTDAMSAGLNALTVGAKQGGVGGAGIAVSFDPTSGSSNPATIARLDNEISIQPGLGHLPQKSDSTNAFLTGPFLFLRHTKPIHGHTKVTPALFGGVVLKVNDQFTFGISLNGNVNLVNYKTAISTPVAAVATAPSYAHSAIALLNNTIAYKYSPTLSFGASVILGWQTFKANPTLFPSTVLSKGANERDESCGVGGRVGVQWDPHEMVGLGLAVTTPIAFGDLTKYSDYLEKNTKYPWVIAGGSIFHVNKQTDVLFDIIGEFWGSSSNFRYKPLKSAGWKNTVEFKLGLQYRVMENLPLRIGYRYAPTVVPKNQILFNSFFSAAIFAEHGVTAGFSYKFEKSFEVDFAFIHRFKKSFTDPGTGTAGLAAKNLKLSGQEYAFLLGLNYKY